MRKSFPLKRTFISWGFWPLLLLFFSFSFSNSHAFRKDCPLSSCGPGVNISDPFRLKQYPQHCGRSEPEFELTCENNTQTVIHFPPRRYYVQEISYETKKMRLLDPALASSSSLPLYSSSPALFNYSFSSRYFWTQSLVFVNCSQPVNDPSYVATASCNHSSLGTHVYAMLGDSTFVSQLHTSCRVVMNLPIILDGIGNLTSCSGIHDVLMRGFYVRWHLRLSRFGILWRLYAISGSVLLSC